jgi:hypothetical protein
LSIQVPRERKLACRLLAEFQKERARIDELMHRPPVMTLARRGLSGEWCLPSPQLAPVASLDSS